MSPRLVAFIEIALFLFLGSLLPIFFFSFRFSHNSVFGFAGFGAVLVAEVLGLAAIAVIHVRATSGWDRRYRSGLQFADAAMSIGQALGT
jgi:hypothetical protein